MRESGYYWVKRDEKWTIELYDLATKLWSYFYHCVFDNYFQEIDERKIERK